MASELESHLVSARFHLQEAARHLPEQQKALAEGAASVLNFILREIILNNSPTITDRVAAVVEDRLAEPPPVMEPGGFYFGAGYPPGSEKRSCPTCGAGPGRPCVARSTGRPQQRAHSARSNW